MILKSKILRITKIKFAYMDFKKWINAGRFGYKEGVLSIFQSSTTNKLMLFDLLLGKIYNLAKNKSSY